MIIKIMITIMIMVMITIMIMVTIMIMIMVTITTRYAPEGKPMYQIVEELAEDNEYFIEVHLV